MSLYPYHNRIKQRIRAGELVGYEMLERHNDIAPCLMLRFSTEPTTRPIREYRFDEYMPLLEQWNRRPMTKRERETACAGLAASPDCYCQTCNRDTRWILGAKYRYILCAGCGTEQFPCPKACTHIDCADARKSLGLKPNTKETTMAKKKSTTKTIKASATTKRKPTKASPKTKVCRKCKKRKRIKTKAGETNFWRNANSPDGLRDECKACFYAWREAKKEEEAANG